MRLKISTYISLWGSIINAALVKDVVRFLVDIGRVELVEYGHECAAIAVVCYAASVVTLTSQIGQGVILHILK